MKFVKRLSRSAATAIGLAGLLLVLAVLLGATLTAVTKKSPKQDSVDARNAAASQALFQQGKKIFRYDTFGDQAFWGGVLQLHKAIEGSKLGGVGDGVSPKTALAVGLKVDTGALPTSLVKAIKAGNVDLNDPKTTLALLKLNAVVGVKGFFNSDGTLSSLGLTCAFCHSTVDDSFAPGIGKRLDGWPNQDLNVGVIVSLAPNLQPVADLLGVDVPTLKSVITAWGPGMFDAGVFVDGKALGPNGKPAPVRIPAAFGLQGHNLHTWEGGWGTVTYWNAFVANLLMHGAGTFFDARLDNASVFPVAAKNGLGHLSNKPDLVTSKLGALEFYQLALPAPKPPAKSYDHAAAARGAALFSGQAKCASCHVLPLTTEPGWNEHKPAEVCTDAFQADRGPDGSYRTASLKGMFAKAKRGFYHDGRFKTLLDVVNHYDSCLSLGLSGSQKSDLVEYLKSL